MLRVFLNAVARRLRKPNILYDSLTIDWKWREKSKRDVKRTPKSHISDSRDRRITPKICYTSYYRILILLLSLINFLVSKIINRYFLEIDRNSVLFETVENRIKYVLRYRWHVSICQCLKLFRQRRILNSLHLQLIPEMTSLSILGQAIYFTLPSLFQIL